MSQENPANAPASSAAGISPDAVANGTGRPRVVRAAIVFVLSAIVCVVAYLALALPAAWFPGAMPISVPASRIALTRGTGQVVNDELVIQGPDSSGVTIVSAVTNFRSTDYPAVAWIALGFPERTDVRLLWRSSYAPERLSSVPITVTSGRLMPTIMTKNPEWIGTITGVALAIRGPLPQPVTVRGVVAKPMGALEVLQDRAREWFAFEPWSGASINTLTGGAEVQDLPLPLLLACTVLLAALVGAAVVHWRPAALGVSMPMIAAAFFLAGWALLDLRWTGNLVRQERATSEQYGGKTVRDKHLSGEDAGVFAFVERAREILPKTPVRVFVAADPEYFRARAAYHLYPHSVWSPRGEDLPRASDLRPGDWLLVYHRRGIQYDPTHHMLRWGDGQTASADVKLLEPPGAALFVIQ